MLMKRVEKYFGKQFEPLTDGSNLIDRDFEALKITQSKILKKLDAHQS
jgi:hypothetical protein